MAVLYESYTAGMDARYLMGSATAGTYSVQTFKPSITHEITSVILNLGRSNTPGTITVGIYATSGGEPTGSALVEGTTDGDTLPIDPLNEERTFTFATNPVLSAGTTYAILAQSALGGANYGKWEYDSTAATYTDGTIYTGNFDGWTEQADKDFYFKEYGNANVPPSSDGYVVKQLVAAGSSQLWYESAAGTMAQLADSVGEIDTSDFLTVAEAYGKVFIANGSNLKVADFTNAKITTDDLNTHAPDFGTVLTGATSGAKMIVDYITSTTADAACTIYGKRTTTDTFSNGETVTGKDDDDNAISFATSAAEDSGFPGGEDPHWYDWTVFGNDSSFGVMPDKATLVCTYRGRVALSGNKDYPNQWYMCKVGNPWNWIYSTTDPLTAVAGNNTDAGYVGDTVKALIPYGDDFLVFGCAGSIYLLDGDPAFGGTLDEKADYTGIYGARSWCKDAQYNLYFFGSNGIYIMSGGRSMPKNISDLHLPNLYSDWSPNQSTKRIVLTYDPDRNGVLTSITTLADGTNLNYFYDLKTEGFYPETYPTACGIFSSYYYEATNSTYKGLLLGTNDGYLRKFLNSAKNDDVGASDTAISSYVVWPIMPMSDDIDKYGKLTSLTFELSGGAADGDFSDTDGVSYALYNGNEPETILEDIKDGADAFTSGTLSGTGRKNRIRPRMRSTHFGLKLYNETASETWAINRIAGDIKPAGKV